jgi:hypothetical protein
VAKRAPSKEEVERLLSIANHFDPALGIKFPEGLEGELSLEGVVLDQEDVRVGRGSHPRS